MIALILTVLALISKVGKAFLSPALITPLYLMFITKMMLCNNFLYALVMVDACNIGLIVAKMSTKILRLHGWFL